MKTIFLLNASFGEWDNYNIWTVGIFDDEQLAIKALGQCEDTIRAWDCPCLIEEVTTYQDLPDYTSDNWGLYKEFEDWQEKKRLSESFNNCWIKEMELNSINL